MAIGEDVEDSSPENAKIFINILRLGLIMRGKTISIYLPDGNPRSIKVCNLRDSIVSAVLIPRSKFKNFSNRDELQRAGIYFLIGEHDEAVIQEIYIGEAEVLLDRLRNHNTNKNFWKYLICFTSDSGKNPLNKAHVKYLESIASEFAQKANKCELKQDKASTKAKLSDSDRDFVLDVFDDIKILISALGYPIFDEKTEEKKDQFTCEGRGVKAKGEYSEEGLLVYEGSEASLDNVNSIGESAVNLKEKLVESKILKKKGNKYLFTKNYLFKSPSSASAVVLGNSSNGWESWKDSKGKTLNERIRK